MRDGYPVFTVGGKPFFIWGAAFFYERISRAQWHTSLRALRALHVNTLDLYVPWNWHELSDGEFDFDGHTKPERDLRGLLAMAREMGFYFVVRPGPVIRNEWRNGGYPDWLLKRPVYEMPLHDILEGRYPATATLQNLHSDDAAAQWLSNSTHLRYSERWLRRALVEFKPVADRVLAIQLDDDQGAYLENQTWPAPHLRAYLLWLAHVVQGATSPRVPVFINTYEMKVTASSPVWAMGNWYQSDVRTIAEHDRAQLEFSTALLGTRPHQPLVLSEFQAGWLLAPESIYPRPSDPSNTLLALHTALDAGARGVIDFPMQDTLSPPGWEAPFANRFYAWDAALTIEGTPSPRYSPTLAFGELVARDGELLAATHLVADAAIVWWPSAVDPKGLTAANITALADATIAVQRSCRRHELSCALIDLRYASDSELRRYRAVIAPPLPRGLRELAFAKKRLAYVAAHRAVLRSLDGSNAKPIVAARIVRGLGGATLHVGRAGGKLVAFLDAANFSARTVRADVALRYPGITRTLRIVLQPRSATLMRVGSGDSAIARRPAFAFKRPSNLVPIRRDAGAPRDTIGAVMLQNRRVRLVIAPEAGGRAFVFEDLAHHTSAFTTVGALRDDLSIQPPPSTTDRIAAYTHTFPAGTFNRPYRVTWIDPSRVNLSYIMADIAQHGVVTFEKRVTLPPDGDTFEVRERIVPTSAAAAQRLVVRSSLAIGRTDKADWHPPLRLWSRDGFALYDPRTHEFAMVRWEHGAVESAHLEPEDRHVVLQLQYAPGRHRTWYSYAYVTSERAALARLRTVAGGTQR